MSKYRKQLPQLGDCLFLTDGGLETTLVFHEGMDLPCFAAFDLLKDEDGIGILRRYFDRYVEEAVGILRAARDAAMPAVISLTVETDGHLPSGEGQTEAIAHTDIETDGYAAYYMINCAHPTHFQHVLDEPGILHERIRGLRANASRCSHAELDEGSELDAGNPEELGGQYRELRRLLPQLTVLGGCCGTDHRHLDAIFAACA